MPSFGLTLRASPSTLITHLNLDAHVFYSPITVEGLQWAHDAWCDENHGSCNHIKSALISSLKLIMWRWKDAAPLCVCFLLSSVGLWCALLYNSSARCFTLTFQPAPLFLWGGSEWLTPKVSSWVTNEFIFINRSQAVLGIAKIIYPLLRLRYNNSSHLCCLDYYQLLLLTSLRHVFCLVISQTCRKPKSVKSVWDKSNHSSQPRE